MNELKLARKALKTVQDESFSVYVGASTGGKCDDGWTGDMTLDLSRAELLYLISGQCGHDEVFKGMRMQKVDVEDTINDMAQDAAWPDGGPCAHVEYLVPAELQDLDERLDAMDVDDAEAVKQMREALQKVEGGLYRFSFSIVDGGDMYNFADGVGESIRLTKDEALGLLHERHDLDEVFDGICDGYTDEDFINEKARALGLADEYDNFSYSGECEALDHYLEAWDYVIDHIFSGDITEDNLDSWMGYFDSEYSDYDMDIEEWMEENEVDEDYED